MFFQNLIVFRMSIIFDFRWQPAYSNRVFGLIQKISTRISHSPVGTIFKSKLNGQNLRGYGGDREHVAANNSLKTILPLPRCGQILEHRLYGLISVFNYGDLPPHNHNTSKLQCVSANNCSILKCEIRLRCRIAIFC